MTIAFTPALRAGLIFTFCLILLDLITGICKAASEKNLRSDAMRQGLWHKLGFVLSIILAAVVDGEMQYLDLPLQGTILPAALVYISLTEITSNLENLRILSPQLNKAAFLQLFASRDSEGQTNQLTAPTETKDSEPVSPAVVPTSPATLPEPSKQADDAPSESGPVSPSPAPTTSPVVPVQTTPPAIPTATVTTIPTTQEATS